MNKNKLQDSLKPIRNLGRTIDFSKRVNVPISEDGKTRFHYPKNHKFQYKEVDYKGFLQDNDTDLKAIYHFESFTLKHFEELPELNIKNLKKFKDLDNLSFIQCYIYFNNKKIASYNGANWDSGEELSILDSNLINYNNDGILIIDPKNKNYEIDEDNFKALIEVMFDMKKYKFII